MFSFGRNGVRALVEHLLEQMQRHALRIMLAVAFANACLLSSIALLTKAASSPVQTVIAVGVALALAAVPLLRGVRFAEDLSRARWLPLAGGLLGAAALIAAPLSRSILFAAFLTPVGVAVLADDRDAALWTTGVLMVGYLIGAAEPAAHSSLGVALGDVAPSFALIVGGLVPAALANSTIEARAARVLEWRERADTLPIRRKPGRPGIAREHDTAILHGVLEGTSSRVIAAQIGSTTTRVRDRILVLAHERGVRTRRELGKLLAEQEPSLSDAGEQE